MEAGGANFVVQGGGACYDISSPVPIMFSVCA
jgi:hypothetical protein